MQHDDMTTMQESTKGSMYYSWDVTLGQLVFPPRELCSRGEFPREGVPGRYVPGAVALGSLV
jgi:hypothetical protein